MSGSVLVKSPAIAQWSDITVTAPSTTAIPDGYYQGKNITAIWSVTTIWTVWYFLWVASTTWWNNYIRSTTEWIRVFDMPNAIYFFAGYGVAPWWANTYWVLWTIGKLDKSTWVIITLWTHIYSESWWNTFATLVSSYINWTDIYVNRFNTNTWDCYFRINTVTDTVTTVIWNNTTWVLTNTTSASYSWKIYSCDTMQATSFNTAIPNEIYWFATYVTVS